MIGYVGTYASTCENGIYRFTFDEVKKQFIEYVLFNKDKNAKYLSLYKHVLAYPFASTTAAIKMINGKESVTYGKETHVSCYITQDEHYIYTANYHEGVVHRYRKQNIEIIACETIRIQEKAGTHQVILQSDEIYVPCCLLDCVMVYDRITLQLKCSISFPKNSGPRHGVLNNAQTHLYMVSEYTCEVFCINITKQYAIEKVLPLLPNGKQGTGAAIRKSDDDCFLYVSVRESNQIYVIDITNWKIVQCVDSGGDHPRDITLTPSQQFLFVANRFSNNLTVFERNEKNGQLHSVATLENILEGVCIVFEGEN